MHVVAANAVEEKEGGIQLGRQFKPLRRTPLVNRRGHAGRLASGRMSFAVQVSFKTRSDIHRSNVVRLSQGHFSA